MYFCIIMISTIFILPVGSHHWILFNRLLARLLIHLKKVGYCNWSSALLASALTFTRGRYNLKSIFYVSFPNLLCMLLVTSSRTSSIITEKKNQNGGVIAIFCI